MKPSLTSFCRIICAANFQKGIGGSFFSSFSWFRLHFVVGYCSFVLWKWKSCDINTGETCKELEKKLMVKQRSRKHDDGTYLIVQTVHVKTAEFVLIAKRAGLVGLGRRSFPRKQRDRVVVRV